MDGHAARPTQRAQATGFFTTIRRDAPGARSVAIVPYSLEYQGELAEAAAAAARGRRADDAAHAEDVPRDARRGLPLQRLLRQRRGLDGARRVASSRPSAPTRSTRTSGSTTRRPSRPSSRCATTPRPTSWRVRRRAAGDREPPAHRPLAAQSEAGRAGADPRGQRGLRLRRRQPRRADRRLQPAQRRAGGPREGQQAGDAEERAGGEVREGALAHREAWRSPRPTSARSRSTPSSPTSSCTS